MGIYQTKSVFYVYRIDHKNSYGEGDVLTMVRVQDDYQHEGHISYEKAKEWLDGYDKGGEYIIQKVFKKF